MEEKRTAEATGLWSWRERVLRGMLTVAAIGGPATVVISLVFGSAPLSWGQRLVFIFFGLALPALRFAPGLGVATRGALVIAIFWLAGVFALSTFGFSSGPGIVLAGTSILAVVFLGRRVGLLMIALSVLAFFAVGILSARGTLHIPGAQLDPGRMTNWTRIGGTFGCLAALLTTAIDYVIRHVEESSRAKARALADLRMAYERLALLHERLDAAKEDERRFIAHELHDELGQVLTVVKLRLRSAPGDGASAETTTLIDQAIDRVRKISSDLRPPLLDEIGLVPALRAYVDAQSALSGVKIELEATPGDLDQQRLPADLEIASFRVVQESLTNALRHASPHNIRVRARRDDSSMALTISDDDRGFDPATLDGAGNGHLGVLGMRERVRARAGTFTIDSRPGTGTRVEVRMPIH